MSPNEYIADSLRDFAQRFVNNRKKDIDKLELKNTNELLSSLYAKVNADPNRGIYFMTVFGRTYGRYQDMKRRYTKSGGEEMLLNLEKWAEKEGVEKFRRGKYATAYAKSDTRRILGAIAWGIIKKYPKQRNSRQRRWWNKGKTADIEFFYSMLLYGYARVVQEELADSFEGKK